MGTQARFPKLWPAWVALDKELTSMLANVNPEAMVYTVDPRELDQGPQACETIRVKAHKELG